MFNFFLSFPVSLKPSEVFFILATALIKPYDI